MKRFLLIILSLLFLSGLCLAGGEGERHTLKFMYHDSPVHYRNQVVLEFSLKFPEEVKMKPILANIKFYYDSVEELAEVVEDHLNLKTRVEKMKVQYLIMNKRDSQTIAGPQNSDMEISISTAGEVLDILGSNSAAIPGSEQPNVSFEGYRQAMVGIINFFYWILPDHQVEVGDKWVIQHAIPSFQEGVPEMAFPLTHQLKKVKRIRKHDCATIASWGDWNIQTRISGEDLNINKTDKDANRSTVEEIYFHIPLSWNGEEVFDITDGCLKTKKVELLGKGIIEVTEAGQKIPFQLNIKVKIDTKRI